MQWHQLDHTQTSCTSLQTNPSSLNFYRLGALPDAQPTVSKYWRHAFVEKFSKTPPPFPSLWASHRSLWCLSFSASDTMVSHLCTGRVQLRTFSRPCFLTIYYFMSAAVTVDSSHTTASSSNLWSRFSPPSNFVNGNVSTMWFMVCRWPQSQEGDWARPHLCKIARHEHWPVRKRSILGSSSWWACLCVCIVCPWARLQSYVFPIFTNFVHVTRHHGSAALRYAEYFRFCGCRHTFR